jgi:hypothetical protein
MCTSVTRSPVAMRARNLFTACSMLSTKAPSASARRRENEHSLHDATQTFVGLMCRLRLKLVISPCIRSRT